jgi:hypothetical protein
VYAGHDQINITTPSKREKRKEKTKKEKPTSKIIK